MSTSLLQTGRFRIALGVWLVGWTALQAWVLAKAGIPFNLALYDSSTGNILLLFVCIIVAIALQFYIPQNNKYTYILALCAVLAILWLFISKAVLLMLFYEDSEHRNFFLGSLFVRGAIGFLVISCAALMSVLWYTAQDQQETQLRKTEADKLWREAELNNLRQQLQPHFLFNSLNSINALIGVHPAEARTMIQQLSDFLRGTLKKDQNEWTFLEEELNHLQLYLNIEKVRFGNRLSASIQNKTKDFQLPVMLLQPVVENAIKFGLYDTTDDITIHINASEEKGYLIVQVTNPYDPETSLPKKGTGFGLSSVQKRLYLLFARTDLLQTVAGENIFTTIIKIPQP